MSFYVSPFVNGDWNDLSLVQLITLLDRRYEYLDLTFSFHTGTSGAVSLYANKEPQKNICQDLRMYVQGFFDGWSIALGG